MARWRATSYPCGCRLRHQCDDVAKRWSFRNRPMELRLLAGKRIARSFGTLREEVVPRTSEDSLLQVRQQPCVTISLLSLFSLSLSLLTPRNLRSATDRHVHKPWTAPDEVLRAAGVELGVDYPERIVENLKQERKVTTDAVLEMRRRHQELNDEGGYDLIVLPSGQKTRVFTKKEFRIDREGKKINFGSGGKGPRGKRKGRTKATQRQHKGKGGGRGRGRGRGKGKGKVETAQ